jgi:hypothetical protein
MYIYVLLFTRKSKKQKRRLLYDLLFSWKRKKSFPGCLGKGTRGRVVLKKGKCSAASAWDGAHREGLFKKKGNALPRVLGMGHSGKRIN